MGEHTQKGSKGTNRRNPDGVLDPKSGIQIVLSAQDHFVNQGRVYHVDGIVALLANTSTFLELRIPARREVHIETLSVWTNIPFLEIRLLENPTIGTPGINAVPVINRNRSEEHSGVASVVEAFDNPATISGGTTLINRRIGSGVKDNSQILTGKTKLILGDKAAPSIYIVEFENADGADAHMSYELVWHEVDSED